MKPVKYRGFKRAHNPKPKMQLMTASKVETIVHGAPLADMHREERLTKELERNKAIHQAAKMQLEENRKLIYIQKQEELKMSTLRESLEKALAEKEARAAKLQSTLDSWSDEEDTRSAVTIDTKQTKEHSVTTISAANATLSISESTFNYVKDNPYTTKKEAVIALTNAGYNPSSTTSLLSHMIRQKQISQDQLGKLTTLVKRYIPLKATPKYKPTKRVVIAHTPAFNGVDIDVPKHVAKTKDTGGIAALQATTPASSTSGLIDTLSVKEARALYLELKSLFGGN